MVDTMENDTLLADAAHVANDKVDMMFEVSYNGVVVSDGAIAVANNGGEKAEVLSRHKAMEAERWLRRRTKKTKSTKKAAAGGKVDQSNNDKKNVNEVMVLFSSFLFCVGW